MNKLFLTVWLLLVFFRLAGAQESVRLEDLPPAPGLLPELPNSAVAFTLEEALTRSQTYHPNLLAAQARLRSAYWAYQRASSPLSTQITAATLAGTNVAGSVAGGNNPSGAGAGFATFAANGRTDTYVQVSQPFLPLGAAGSLRQEAFQDYQMARANWKEKEVTQRQLVKDAFYRLQAAQEILRVSQENFQLAQEGFQIADRRFQMGAGPRLDRMDAGVLLSRAGQDQIQAEAGLLQAQAVLASLALLPASAPVHAAGCLGLPADLAETDRFLARATGSPKVVSAVHALARSQASLDLAAEQANPTPLLTFVRDLTTQTYQFQVGLQFPLDWGQIGHEVEAKQEMVRGQEHVLAAVRLEVESSLQVAVQQYRGVWRNAANFRETILLPSEESTRITQYGFRRGAIPYVRLITSQQNLSAVRKEYTALVLSTWLARNAVEASLGEDGL